MELGEIVAALCQHAIEEAEERGYRRAKEEIASRERYIEKKAKEEKLLTFPSTFALTPHLIGWLIANHRLSYLSGGHWNVRVPVDLPHFKNTSGTSVHQDGEWYNMLHTYAE